MKKIKLEYDTSEKMILEIELPIDVDNEILNYADNIISKETENSASLLNSYAENINNGFKIVRDDYYIRVFELERSISVTEL